MDLQRLLLLLLRQVSPVSLHVVDMKLLFRREDSLFRMLPLALLVSAKVMVRCKVAGELLQVLVVHVVPWPLPPAQEAKHVLGLHMRVKLLVRVEALVTKLARGVSFEPSFSHWAFRVTSLVVSVQLLPRVQDLLLNEDSSPLEAYRAHEKLVLLLQM